MATEEITGAEIVKSSQTVQEVGSGDGIVIANGHGETQKTEGGNSETETNSTDVPQETSKILREEETTADGNEEMPFLSISSITTLQEGEANDGLANFDGMDDDPVPENAECENVAAEINETSSKVQNENVTEADVVESSVVENTDNLQSNEVDRSEEEEPMETSTTEINNAVESDTTGLDVDSEQHTNEDEEKQGDDSEESKQNETEICVEKITENKDTNAKETVDLDENMRIIEKVTDYNISTDDKNDEISEVERPTATEEKDAENVSSETSLNEKDEESKTETSAISKDSEVKNKSDLQEKVDDEKNISNETSHSANEVEESEAETQTSSKGSEEKVVGENKDESSEVEKQNEVEANVDEDATVVTTADKDVEANDAAAVSTAADKDVEANDDVALATAATTDGEMSLMITSVTSISADAEAASQNVADDATNKDKPTEGTSPEPTTNESNVAETKIKEEVSVPAPVKKAESTAPAIKAPSPSAETTAPASKVPPPSAKPTAPASKVPPSSTEPTAPATKVPPPNMCSQCNVTKSCKFQVLAQGTTRYICTEECFKEFKIAKKMMASTNTSTNTDKSTTPGEKRQTRSMGQEQCNMCHKDIKSSSGFMPVGGQNNPLCSEECFKKYQAVHGPKRGCSQCSAPIQCRTKCLTWETMEFCNEECLGKYQNFLGSHCACCKSPVQHTSLGKYCVRFGSDIRQFCSNTCLEEFKKGLKVCSFCQKDISSIAEGFLAPVGNKGKFKDFCSQQCMGRYETMNQTSTGQTYNCSVCNKSSIIKTEVVHEGKMNRLCSEPCMAAFRYANKVDMEICDMCSQFYSSELQHTIQYEGGSKKFCSKTCVNVFVLTNRKIMPCSWCKVKKYNFDMIERTAENNQVQLFCSLNCLSLFRVSLNASSSRSIPCDFCRTTQPAQYHLTMSDASIRNFCSYNCVMQFQNQFSANSPLLPPAPPKVPPSTPQVPMRMAAALNAGAQVRLGGTGSPAARMVSSGTNPIISNVMSLAGSTARQPITTYGRPPGPSLISPPVVKVVNAAPPAPPPPPPPPQVVQQVIVKPPPPKVVKNKSVQCKPFMQTKGVSCKPHPCHKSVQTDEWNGKPTILPVPVPIYIPVPMHMFTGVTPIPVPFALPIPVPIFIPTTRKSADGILKQIRQIKEKIPDDPFEAELLMMAEMVAGEQKKDESSSDEEEDKNDKESSSQNQVSGDTATEVDSSQADTSQADVVQPDLEAVIPQSANQEPEVEKTRSVRARGRGQKRASSIGGRRSSRGKRARIQEEEEVEEEVEEEAKSPADNHVTETPKPPPVDSKNVLKYSYGVSAWKQWVIQKNSQIEKSAPPNKRLKTFKTDLLQLTADELNYTLCMFVKEVRKPNGEDYAPDSVYYLCLGIQQFLYENARIDNIFTDPYYDKFSEYLHEALQKFEVSLDGDGYPVSRIEEEILWESKQLGVHSPYVLLNTLMYFNTKYFMLKDVEDHTRFSFSHILKHWKKTSSKGGSSSTKSVLLRYYPPPSVRAGENSSGSKKKKDDSLEQLENVENPLRCPVKLYEFYLSKCPESIKNRNDVFYLYPERSCVPDSPVWYSNSPLSKESIAKMLQRIRMVREITEAHLNAE